MGTEPCAADSGLAPEPKRFCGGCHYLDEHRRICALNLSYAAFVYPWSERGDCPGYLDEERAKAEQQKGIYSVPPLFQGLVKP